MSHAEELYRKAQALAAESKDGAALLAFEEAFRQDPTHFKAIFGAGLMCHRLGEYEQARFAFSTLLELHPELPDAYYSRALSLERLGKYAEAIVDLNIGLKLNPDCVDMLYARGICLKHLERFPEALEMYSQVLAKGAHAGASHGRATIRSATGNYNGATQDFTDCIKGGVDDAGVRLLRGIAYFQLGLHEDAVSDLSKAIEMDPQGASAYFRRSQVYRAMGEEERAAQDFATGCALIELSSTNSEPLK